MLAHVVITTSYNVAVVVDGTVTKDIFEEEDEKHEVEVELGEDITAKTWRANSYVGFRYYLTSSNSMLAVQINHYISICWLNLYGLGHLSFTHYKGKDS